MADRQARPGRICMDADLIMRLTKQTNNLMLKPTRHDWSLVCMIHDTQLSKYKVTITTDADGSLVDFFNRLLQSLPYRLT